MSQTETNHHASETAATVLNGRRIGDSSRVFSKAGSAFQAAKEDHHASCEAASRCSRFLVTLSHQMRTRLSSIVGVTEMMLESDLSDAQKEFVETIGESANALALMTDEIADFSRCLAMGAEQHAHQSELIGNEMGVPDHGSNGNGSEAVAAPAVALSIGAEDILSKTPANGNRAFNRSGTFRTRVPPDTARLIRILVAEDHLMNQHVMLRMLARLGYTADAVCNGVEAVAALTRSPYDIVLMDCQMPELDGYDATRQIRRSGGRFRSTPIIAVTANAMEGDREKCLASGMSDYMSKPVLAQTLATTLEKWILPNVAPGSAGSAQSPPAAASHDAPPWTNQVQAESRSADGGAMKAAPVEITDAVDAGALETLRSMDASDEGFITKIIELFLADMAERMTALKTAACTRDGAGLKSIAHALKGSCGHFGATRLAALCRKIEQIGDQQVVSDPSEAIRELEAEAARVRIALEEAKRIASADSATMEEPD